MPPRTQLHSVAHKSKCAKREGIELSERLKELVMNSFSGLLHLVLCQSANGESAAAVAASAVVSATAGSGGAME